MKAGVVLNPATPLESIQHVLHQVDLILLMSGEPLQLLLYLSLLCLLLCLSLLLLLDVAVLCLCCACKWCCHSACHAGYTVSVTAQVVPLGLSLGRLPSVCDVDMVVNSCLNTQFAYLGIWALQHSVPCHTGLVCITHSPPFLSGLGFEVTATRFSFEEAGR